MRNFLRNVATALGISLSLLAAWNLVAFALTVPPTYAPRYFQEQMVHYTRINVTFNSVNGLGCTLVSNTCTVKAGALPYNAMLLRASQQIITSFNSGTTDTLAIGTASGGGQLVAAQSVHGAAGNPSALTLVAGAGGISALGNGIAQTGTGGGFDIWVTYAQTGAAPTAGQAILVLEWIAPNDGTCAPVPQGATAGAC